MVTILEKSLECIIVNPHNVVTEHISPVTKEWPLMSTPLYVILIIAAYLYFSMNLGPKLMKNRQPFELERFMIYYNAIQMVLNCYLLFVSLREILKPGYSFLVMKDVNHEENWIYVYYYFLVKILDLADTVFMVLRKKYSQISFLHLYHHTMMVMIGWVFVAYVGATASLFFGVVNTFVHMVMYFYYLLTAARPEYKKSVWWKRHLTQLQLGQFIIVTLHATIACLTPGSSFPKALVGIFIPQGVIMFVLFWDFYKKAYLKKKKVP